MDHQPGERTEGVAAQRGLILACVVEGGLGVVAVGVAWLTSTPLSDSLGFSAGAVGWGLVATLPLLLALAVLVRVAWQPIVEIRRIVQSFARQLLAGASWSEIALLCVLAGIGEELLFRGVIQVLIAEKTNAALGVLLAGILFGAAHFLTKTYFVLAVVVGCYLGWLFVATKSLTAPIITHAVYDFIALAIVLRNIRRGTAPDDAIDRSPASSDHLAKWQALDATGGALAEDENAQNG